MRVPRGPAILARSLYEAMDSQEKKKGTAEYTEFTEIGLAPPSSYIPCIPRSNCSILPQASAGGGHPARRLAARVLLRVSIFTLLAATAQGAKKPNILFILTDDQGYGDVSIHGASDVRTPHLETLASQGMRFTAARANATVCSPTRAAILSGRFPDRAGVPGVIRTDPESSWGYFAPALPTLADHLRAAGYHTALIGKWHLGLSTPNTPNERGFDHFHGFLGDMMDSYSHHRRHNINYLRLNKKPIKAEGHATDVFTSWSIDFLQKRAALADEPFFLFLAYNAPHFPIEPPAEWLEKVKKRQPELDPKRAANVAFCEHLDDALGRLLTALDQTGLTENTLVVFTSDNGGSLPHGQSNRPWRDGKQSHYDGGLRVPFVARWPGHITAGTTCETPVLTFDVFPAFLTAAGAQVPAGIDPLDLSPLFAQKPAPQFDSREQYFVRREGGGLHGGLAYHAVIRDGWKLMRNDPESSYELYHLAKDPGETRNLLSQQTTRANELKTALRRHIQRGGEVPWQAPSPTQP